MKINLNNNNIISLDFEGNGCNPAEIVEIGIAHIENLDTIGNHQSWLVKPKNKITWQATKIHGIKNKDIENCDDIHSLQDTIYQELNHSFLIAHNAHVELKILSNYFPEYNPIGVIDTLKLSKAFLGKKIPSHSLTSIINYLNYSSKIEQLVKTEAHRAEYDAIASGLIFLYFYNIDKEKVISLIKINSLNQPSLF